MRKHRLPAFFVAALLALAPYALAATQNRITGAIADADRVPLANTVPARARLASDTGTLAPNTRLENLTLRFNFTAAQQGALDQLLIDQQNPNSPKFHQWLTPEQFAAQFGVSASDQATVSAWLRGRGFTVTGIARGGTFVTFSGTAAQVQSAFGTTLHTFSENGQTHFSNVGDPTFPSAIASVVSGITGLNDFRPRVRVRHSIVTSSSAKPEFTSSITNSHYIAPGDFYTIYDINPLLTNNINGTGITIAVIGQVDISIADVAAFRSASGLSANVPTVKLFGKDPGAPVSSTSTPSTDDLTEAQLDVEWSGAVAPSASILFVNSTDVFAGSLTNAIDSNLAPIISSSYGDCESNVGASSIASYQILFQQANAQGQTIISPAGDSGATDCEYNTQVATTGLAVDFPADSPNVTGLGGTQFAGDLTGNYWNSANGNFSGSAISYIPESAWNETAAYALQSPTTYTLSSGGGGASTYFTKPYYQTGTGVPLDFSRDVPDLSLDAAFIHDAYLICAQGSCVNGYRYTDNTLNPVGGTSVAAPSFAGILALVEQKTGSRLGNANPTIYALANSTFYSSVFHDITSGNNAQPCQTGSPNCPSGGTIGFSAGTGYDQATGWGSVDAANLVNDWSLVTPAASTIGISASATTLTTPTTNVSAGTPITLTATVASATTGVTTAPSGTVQFLVDGTVSGTGVPLSGNTATFVLATATLSSGAHTVTAAFSGDTTYAGSKGAYQVDITSATAADFSLTPITSTITVASGGTSSGVTYTVAPLNGFTGSVAFTASSTSSTLNATYSFSVTPLTITGTTSGSTVLTLEAFAAAAKSGTGSFRAGKAVAASESYKSLYAIAGSGITFAGLLLLTLPRRRRWTGLLLVVVSAGLVAASGCTGNQVSAPGSTTSTGGNVNATPGTYPLVVTATGTTAAGTVITHNVNVSFVVQ